jgi:hypothetical protein
MEISQGNSLCFYIYPKQAKMSYSPIFSFFFFNKIKEQEDAQGEGRSPYQWEGGGEERA